MTRLDDLIITEIDTALTGASHPTAVIFTDPNQMLLRHLLERCEQVIVGSRSYQQAHAAAEAATTLGARDRVIIAGLDGSLRLDELLDEMLDKVPESGVSGKPAAGPIIAATHLPKSLAELNYYARALAAGRTGAAITLVAGGNNKHMTHNQNTVLADSFTQVRASRGQGKFRCLIAAAPADAAPYAPAQRDLLAVGGVFSGTTPDYGGEFLAAQTIADMTGVSKIGAEGVAAGPIIDLGCGNGSVSVALQSAFPEARIIATDISSDAIVSTRLNAPEVEVLWDDAGSSLPAAAAQAVLLNPPFHAGTTVDPTLVQGLLVAAKRLLRPGGVLYLVHNSHLRYRDLVAESFKNVSQLGRNQRFTVLRAEV